MYSTLGLGVLMSIVGMAARVSEILSLCSGFAGCNVVVAFGSWIFLVGCFSLVLLALMVFLFLDGCVAGFGVAYGSFSRLERAMWLSQGSFIFRWTVGWSLEAGSFLGLGALVVGFLAFWVLGEAWCFTNAALGFWHLSLCGMCIAAHLPLAAFATSYMAVSSHGGTCALDMYFCFNPGKGFHGIAWCTGGSRTFGGYNFGLFLFLVDAEGPFEWEVSSPHTDFIG
ncbi:hypothetical protein U1Q18_051175 [Sarracenia purpurea var. burkii]